MTQKSEVRVMCCDGLEENVVKISEQVWISGGWRGCKIILDGEEMWVWKEEEEVLVMFPLTALTL